jgi:hypothetical protein
MARAGPRIGHRRACLRRAALRAPCYGSASGYLLSFEYKPREKSQKTKERYPATTYSPTPLPGQYHRRWWA